MVRSRSSGQWHRAAGGPPRPVHEACSQLATNEMANSSDGFQIEWHGNCVVITPTTDIEHLRWDIIDTAAQIVMSPLKKTKNPTVVFDLSKVAFFGSVFLALLLKCHKYVKERGGEMVLAAPAQMARELLSVTALDTLWALYDTTEEAVAALEI